MPKVIKIKKGLNIPLTGEANGQIVRDEATQKFGIVPDDFPGYKWKAAVKEGDTVEAGSPLLYAKEDEDIKLVSPVAGTVLEVKRGERRKIEYISVEASDKETIAKKYASDNAEEILASLKATGIFAMIRQRPFDTVPFMPVAPRDIFITAFDSAPLAPALIGPNDKTALEAGIGILKKLTAGNVYISIKEGDDLTSGIAEVYEFSGPHPAGNVGVQIAHIKPVNKGEVVWTLDAATAVRIGRIFSEGILDFSTDVALTGPEIKNPHVVKTLIGASLDTLLEGAIDKDGINHRVISGNVLTGKRVDPNTGFLRYPYRQITVIPEGDSADEFMGWASLNPAKYSVKHSFPTFLNRLGKPFNFDARIRGGHRAMILSNEYDKVFPFDIYPEYLIKAIMAKDIERMEQLGIYEVAPEDFALPEFVDTSKIELQKIVREGLDYLRQETI